MRDLLLALVSACTSVVKPPAPPPVALAEIPCKPGPPLAAADIYKELETFSWSAYSDEPKPRGTFGTCSVDGPTIRTASGALVAEMGCGMRVVQRGITDHAGLQIGARGQEVIDRKRRPDEQLFCFASGPAQSRCGYDRREDSDTNDDSYVIDGALPGCAADAPCEPVRGKAARAFFAPREVVELHVSFWCH